MKKTIIAITSILLWQNAFADGTSKTSTNQTQIPPAPPKVSSYYGYSYRAFTGVPNPGSVNLIDGDMHMHVLSLRHNINEKWSWRVGSAYLIHTLNFTMKVPGQPLQNMTVNVEGFGDVRTAALYTAYKNKVDALDFVLGLNVPTAPILKDEMTGKPLAPQDQFSSGTYDFMLAVNYAYNFNDWSFTEKLDGVIHTGKNSAGYRLGDDFGFTTAVAYNIKPWLVPVFSARFVDRKDLAVNEFHQPKKANVKFGSGWEGVLALRSGIPLKADMSMRLGFEAGAPVFKTSNTTQYTVGETLWYVATNLTASY